MIKAYFNPYCGLISCFKEGKERLLATARAYKKIHSIEALRANDPSDIDSVRCVNVTEDNFGAKYRVGDLIHTYSGPDKDLVKWFCLQLTRGMSIAQEEFQICEDWTLHDWEVPVTVLEYAYRNDGIAITISDDSKFLVNNFRFRDNAGNLLDTFFLPNIHGQTDLDHFEIWVQKWQHQNYNFKTLIERRFNAIFCNGVENSCFPSAQEQDGLLEVFSRAKTSNYNRTSDVLVQFTSKQGTILELRSYGDGFRMFFIMKDNRPIIGGFYRKSEAIAQNKAGEKAAKRLKKSGYL